MSDARRIFQDYADRNEWGDPESKSGPGSTLMATVNLRFHLVKFCREFQISTFFDAPCGDFNWMKEVRFPPGTRYIGGDIVPTIVSMNNVRYGREGRTFVEFDITSTEFPTADVWFCRDCFFHLPYRMVLDALKNYHRANIPWLMTTTHLNITNFENSDTPLGGYDLIDLFKEPYLFPKDVRCRIADYHYPYPPREMCVWDRDQVGVAIKRMEASL